MSRPPLDDYRQALLRIAATGAVWAHQRIAAETAADAAALLPVDTATQEHEFEHRERLRATVRAVRRSEAHAFVEWLAAYREARAVARGRDSAAWEAYDRAWGPTDGTRSPTADDGSILPVVRARALAAADAFAAMMQAESTPPATP